MAAVAALITLEPPAVDEAMIMTIAPWTTEPIRPSSLLQSSLTFLLGAVEPLEPKQGESFLELDSTARHELTGTCAPVYASGSLCAEPSG